MAVIPVHYSTMDAISIEPYQHIMAFLNSNGHLCLSLSLMDQCEISALSLKSLKASVYEPMREAKI